MENAILVEWLDIKKVEVNFDDTGDLMAQIGCRRVFTIHTQKTMEMSRLLGIHIMGYVDREGDDINNKKACEITGYDYLGSKLLLFKTDDSWHELPFTEDEFDRVYTYITTGKVKPQADMKNPFFKKYPINPILPNFGFEPKIVNDKENDNVIYFVYNLMFKDLTKLGEQLFHYSDRLVNEFEDYENVKISPDGDYLLKCATGPSMMYFVVAIQAITKPKEKPLIDDEKNLKKIAEEGLF